MSGELLHCPSLVLYILILLASLLFSSFTVLLNMLYLNPWVFSVFPLPHLSDSEGAAVWGWVAPGVKPQQERKIRHVKLSVKYSRGASFYQRLKAEPDQITLSNTKSMSKIIDHLSSILWCTSMMFCTWQLHSMPWSLTPRSSPGHGFSCADYYWQSQIPVTDLLEPREEVPEGEAEPCIIFSPCLF